MCVWLLKYIIDLIIYKHKCEGTYHYKSIIQVLTRSGQWWKSTFK